MATDRHQKFQQCADRCPSALRNGAAQSTLAAVQAAAGCAVTQDRYSGRGGDGSKLNQHQSAPHIAVQAVFTSNEQLHHHQRQHSTTTTSSSPSSSPVSATLRRVADQNNNNFDHTPGNPPVSPPLLPPPPPQPAAASAAAINSNHCHHQAATRTLLFHHHHRLDHATDSSLATDLSLQTDLSSSGADEQPPTPPPNYHEIPGIVPAYQGRSSGPPPSYDDVVNPNAPPPSYQSLFGQVREARKSSNGLVDLLRQLFLILVGTLGCTMIIGFLLLIPITMILVGVVYVNECKAENIPTFLVVGGIVWIMKNILNCYNQFKKDSSNSNRPPPHRSTISSRAASQSSSSSSSTALSAQLANADSPASVLIVGHQTSSDNTNHSTTTTTQPITQTATTRTRREHEQSANRIRTPSLIGITSFRCESMLNYFLIVWFFAGCIVVYRIYEPDYDNPMSQSYCHRTVYLYAFWLITSAFIIMAIVLSCLCCLMASSLMNCNHRR